MADITNANKIYSQVFGNSLPDIVASKFGYHGVKRTTDAKGAQFEHATTAARAVVTDAQMLSYSNIGEQPFIARGGELDKIFANIKSPGNSSINLVWDRNNFSAILNKSSVGGLAQQQPAIVSARDLLYRQFPEVAASLNMKTPTALGAAIEEASSSGRTTGEIKHLIAARKMLFSGVENLSETQINHTVLLGGAMRAIDKGERHIFGLDFLKSFLGNAGVPGLSDGFTNVFSNTDPHNIMNAMSAGARGAVTEGSEMYNAIRRTAGDEYLKHLKVGIDSLEGAADALNIRMDDSGALYLGVGNDMKSYAAMPTGYIDNVGSIGVSRGGSASGIVNIGGKRSFARPIYDVNANRKVSFVEKGLKTFFGGITNTSEGRAGITMDNLGMAIHVGAERLRKAKQAGGELAGLLETTLSLGQQSILPSLYAQGTATVPSGVLKNVNDALVEMLTGSANHKLPLGAYSKAIKDSLESIGNSFGNFDFSAASWSAVKHDINNANVLPSMGMESHFLPGVLNDPRVIAKGTYHIANTRETILNSHKLGRMQETHSGLSSRITSVGTTRGGAQIDSALARAYARDGRVATSSTLAAVMYVPSLNPNSVAQGRRMFGDSMFYMTNLGKRGIGYDSSSMKSVKTFMTREDIVNYLNQIRGKGGEWDKYIEGVMRGEVREGFHGTGQGLKLGKINRKALGELAPARGTTHFFGINLSDYSSERNFAFGRIGERSHGSFVLGSGMRMTAATGAGNLYGEATEQAVHFISGMESLNAQNAFHTQFHHKLNLLTTKNAHGTISDFMREYTGAGGQGLTLSESGKRIIAQDNLTQDGFNKYADKALINLGFSRESIEGEASSVLTLMGKHKAAREAARRSPGSLVFLQGVGERAGGAEDIAGMRHGLRQRLDTLKLIGAGSGGNDPLWKIMATGLERQTGVVLNKKNFGSTGFIKSMPSGTIKNSIRPIFEKGFAPKSNNVRSIKQFGQDYGLEINSRTIAGEGIGYNALKSTKLFDHTRPGFYLDLGEEIGVGVKHSRGSETFLESSSRFMWIDSGKELSDRVRGAGDDVVRFGKDDYARKILNILEGSVAGDSHTVRKNAREAIELQMSVGKKEGYFDKKMSFEAPISAKGRLISTMSTAKDATKSILKDGLVDGSVFEVGVNDQMLREMFTNKRSRKFNQEGYEAAYAKAKSEGIYGMLQPTPQHGGGHIPMVKIKLDETLKSGAGVAIRTSDFIASFIERDFDKDQAGLMAIFDKETMGYAREALGVKTDKEVNAALASHYRQQRKKHAAYAAEYEKAESVFSDFFRGKGNLKIGSAKYYEAIEKYHAFGNLPPVAWSPFYSQFEFNAAVASPDSAEKVAGTLNKLGRLREGGRAITAEDIGGFRKAMTTRGLGLKKTFNEATLMQHNVAQAALAKGGELMPDFARWHDSLGRIQEAARAGSITIEEAIQSATKASRSMGQAMASAGTISKLKGYSELFAGATREEAGNIFGDLMGVFTGAHAFAKGKFLHEKSRFSPIIRQALSTPEGARDAVALAELLETVNMKSEGDGLVRRTIADKILESSQEALAEANRRAAEGMPGGGSAVGGSFDFINKNWKAIGLMGGGLIAARALYGALSPDPTPPPLPISNMGAAPLPPEPMVSQQSAGPSMPMQAPVARARQMSGMTSSRSHSSIGQSMSVDSPGSSFNMGAIGSSWNRTTVRDDRSYTSGWEHQRLADANGRSDFVHKYMDL